MALSLDREPHMAFDAGKLARTTELVHTLIGQLEIAIDLIGRLDEESFSSAKDGRGGIGAHIRHTINFVEAVLAGSMSHAIDYANRSRDRRFETDRSFALGRIRYLIEALENVPIDLRNPVTVTSEIDPTLHFSSTLGREIEFVISHNVHHHALIKDRLAEMEIGVDEKFGVAPSTLEYWRKAGR